MTALTNGDTRLSRLSVASLDDLGYFVNYDGSDNFTASDLDASCRCNRRLHEDTHRLTTHAKRTLSTAEIASREAAFNFGLDRLRDNFIDCAKDSTGSLKNVGNEVVSVFFRVPETSQITYVVVKDTDRH